jgi:hypothetical protein
MCRILITQAREKRLMAVGFQQRASGLLVKTTGLCHVAAKVQVLLMPFCD